ncbi:MAG: ATP-dependent DNA helicase RecG [Nitrospirae bacterium]|nr:ATP-dependent DNA helicase RecG [Nitrospirota bacterium]
MKTTLETPKKNLTPQLMDSIQYIKGVGPRRAELFKRLGINTVEDALTHLPRRYEDRGNLKKISQIKYGEIETISGIVKAAGINVTTRKRMKIFELVVGDGTGIITAKWFNQPYMKNVFKIGQKVILNGKVKMNNYYGYGAEIDNPEYEIIDDDSDVLLHTGRIVPIYPETSGITSRQIRVIMKTILDTHQSQINDYLPSNILEQNKLMPLSAAFSEIHFPSAEKDIGLLNSGRSEMHRRLAFDEFFFLELGLALRKKDMEKEKRDALKINGELTKQLIDSLPFKLTSAQVRVIDEIKGDLTSPHPMNRLIQGDVGCGKTVVALSAMLMAIENSFQTAIMAPTEILAEQHYLNIKSLINKLSLKVILLTSSRKDKEDIKAVENGEANIVIGTHALIQDDIRFKKLSLAVIDEQHKFGVMQRGAIKKKGYNPDILIMTATPIPRTLAMSVYGDLDISVIDELPPGRTPIKTMKFYKSHRPEAFKLVKKEILQGRQCYVIYPLIEESEKVDLKAATEMAEHIKKDIFPEYNLGLLHGRIKTEEKEKIMKDFKEGRINILVSTTVIEVGIDVPNASVMLIEHAERFGLAQLHQLRGRVGRGQYQSYCLLMAEYPLSDDAKRRLDIMVKTNNGFDIAEEDLNIRGPGEFFGTRQSGLPELKNANILRDVKILEAARKEAFEFIKKDPLLSMPEHISLKTVLKQKWLEKLEMGAIS